METIQITNEDQALELLEQIKNGTSIDRHDIKFDNWPKVEIVLRGEDFDGSIPTRIMPPILALQKQIHQVYATVKYGVDSDKRLSKEDRESSELIVTIDKGSSIFTIKLDDTLNNVIKKAISEMTTTQVLSLVLGAGVIYSANSMWKDYLNHQARIHEMDIRVEVSQEETRRLELMQGIINNNVTLSGFNQNMNRLRSDMLKKMQDRDQFVINNTPVIQGNEAKQLVKPAKVEPVEDRIDGTFKILDVASGRIPGGYKVHVENIDTKEKLLISVPADTLTDEQKTKLQDGEWNKKPLDMQINVRKLRGQIKKATLIKAGLDTNQTPSPKPRF
ncbi:MAG: hypothetical protein PSN35_03925 [Candidatus Thioglobus sp.]|uniref:hypothetical protein n=1 Tax=Candidatus Thioglobus sp. TaxID=2026721 RepID=UPI00262D1E5A|nr:hypothetical protein [Candidatus Thioglobus sp.]MDC9726967.1 hypothetical protein [Candidatus Thioglobus sp.]